MAKIKLWKWPEEEIDSCTGCCLAGRDCSCQDCDDHNIYKIEESNGGFVEVEDPFTEIDIISRLNDMLELSSERIDEIPSMIQGLINDIEDESP